MTQSTGNIEPHEGVDPYDNAETREVEAEQTPSLARAGGEGPAPSPAREPGEGYHPEGTAAGDPLSGVTIDAEDADQAVSGDTGPEHPGTRRSS